jgi:RHS repeat-associated protein
VRYQNGTLPTDYAFTHQRSDATSGLDYYGACFYDPVAGQFTSADTTLAGGLNRYAYVGGNPETRTDPSGHAEEPPDERIGGNPPVGSDGNRGSGSGVGNAVYAFRNTITLAPGQDSAQADFTLGHGQNLLVYYNGAQILLTYTIAGKQYGTDVTDTKEAGMWAVVLQNYLATPHVVNQGVERRLSEESSDPMAWAAGLLQHASGGSLTQALGNGWLVTSKDSRNKQIQFRLMNGTDTPNKGAGVDPYLRIQVASQPGSPPGLDDPYLDPSGWPLDKMNSTNKGATHLYLGAQAGNSALILALAFTIANNYESSQYGASYPATP